jgi:hypothetical protein
LIMLPETNNTLGATEIPVADNTSSEASQETVVPEITTSSEATPNTGDTQQNAEPAPITEAAAPENTQQEAANTDQAAEPGEAKSEVKKPLTYEEIKKQLRGEEPEVVAKPPVKPQPKARDMTGIAPEHHKLFRNMSGEAFDLAKEKYIKATALEQEVESLKKTPQIKPVNVYDHPEGYVLSEDYRNQNYRTTVSTEINTHYQTQLAKAMRGEKWRDGDIDPKTGKFVVSQTEQEPTPESIAQLTGFVTQTSMQALAEQQKLAQVGQQYQQAYQQDVGQIEAAIEQYYKPLTDPKHPTAKLQEQAKSLIPERFRNHPMSKLFILTLAENARINGESKALKQEMATLKANRVDAGKAQPTKPNFVSAPATKPTLTYSQMKEMLANK